MIQPKTTVLLFVIICLAGCVAKRDHANDETKYSIYFRKNGVMVNKEINYSNEVCNIIDRSILELIEKNGETIVDEVVPGSLFSIYDNSKNVSVNLRHPNVLSVVINGNSKNFNRFTKSIEGKEVMSTLEFIIRSYMESDQLLINDTYFRDNGQWNQRKHNPSSGEDAGPKDKDRHFSQGKP